MHDIKIAGALIVDGTGEKERRAEILISDGDIVQITGHPTTEGARRVIEGDGLVACPGFIDLHSHSDFALFAHPAAESKVHQGVTLEVTGNCGMAPYPLSDRHQDDLFEYLGGRSDALPWNWTDLDGYLQSLAEREIAVNTAPLAAHGSLRLAVMGFADREPSSSELQEMRSLLRKDLAAGAFGLSTGLIYAPGVYAGADEISSLAEEVARSGGFYATHIRGETEVLLDAVEEALAVGEASGIPVHISHLKAAGRSMWGKSEEVLQRMESARQAGLDVSGDVYPYRAGSTKLLALLPPRLLEQGVDGLVERLGSDDERRRIQHEIREGSPGWWNPVGAAGGWDAVMVTSVRSPENSRYVGMRVTEIAQSKGCSPLDAACDLLVQERGAVGMIIFMMHEDDIRTFLTGKNVAVGSDGSATAPGPALTHPRSYGTFPRILARYVRKEQLLDLPEAVHRMTGLPAERLGLKGRGFLCEEHAADIVLFSPDEVEDTATYESPHSYPRGIEHVLVNGVSVIDGGHHTGVLPGKVLRRTRK